VQQKSPITGPQSKTVVAIPKFIPRHRQLVKADEGPERGRQLPEAVALEHKHLQACGRALLPQYPPSAPAFAAALTRASAVLECRLGSGAPQPSRSLAASLVLPLACLAKLAGGLCSEREHLPLEVCFALMLLNSVLLPPETPPHAPARCPQAAPKPGIGSGAEEVVSGDSFTCPAS